MYWVSVNVQGCRTKGASTPNKYNIIYIFYLHPTNTIKSTFSMKNIAISLFYYLKENNFLTWSRHRFLVAAKTVFSTRPLVSVCFLLFPKLLNGLVFHLLHSLSVANKGVKHFIWFSKCMTIKILVYYRVTSPCPCNGGAPDRCPWVWRIPCGADL